MEAEAMTADRTEPRSKRLAAARARRGHRDWMLRRWLAAGDAVAVLLAVVVALTLPGDRAAAGTRMLWGLAAIPLMIVLFKLYGLYDRDVKRISHSTVDDLPWLLHATVVGALLLWLYSKYTPLHRMYFDEVLAFGIGVIVLGTTARFTVRGVTGRVIDPERAVLVGGGAMALALVRKLAAHPEYRLEVIGSLAADSFGDTAEDAELPILGTPDQLDQVATRHDVTRVIFSSGEFDEDELEPVLRDCRALALKVSVLPKLSDVLGPAVEIDDVEGVTVLGLNPPWLPRSSRAVKRAMDIAIAALCLILFAPVLLLIAIAIKLDSHGRVFFAQERVGRGGRRFRLYKFRTMVTDAEERRAELLADSTDPNWLKLEHDPRITRVGRRMRRLSLDELPQLWNVLRGDMSMVGPRPLIASEDDRVEDWARGRLDLTPGITGYWQVLGRTRIPFEEMVKLDYLYVMNWSLWEDVRLMLRTLPVVLQGRGAN
jgi:exopolysaccharide biosynthesis polyprenyl glycosylphosphotransferase